MEVARHEPDVLNAFTPQETRDLLGVFPGGLGHAFSEHLALGDPVGDKVSRHGLGLTLPVPELATADDDQALGMLGKLNSGLIEATLQGAGWSSLGHPAAKDDYHLPIWAPCGALPQVPL